MTYLLDTCTFLWLNLEPEKLSKRAMEICSDAGSLLALSAASAWEVMTKHAAERLILPLDPAEYIRSRREVNRIVSLGVREQDVFQLANLPPLHKNPFDRILISQALARDLSILTPDARVRQYHVATAW